MHGDYKCYAVAWTPRRSSRLGKFGVAWTGWCPETGARAEPAERCAIGAAHGKEIGALALSGLHAPIYPPVSLGPGRSLWALVDALQELAREVPAALLPRLRIEVADSRVVLAPERACETFAALAGRVARLMPAIGAEPAPGAPTALQIALTGPIRADGAARLAERLDERMVDVLAGRHRIADIALLGDPGEGRPWRLLERYPLAAGPVRRGRPEPAGMSCPGLSPMPPLTDVLGSTWETVIH